MTVSLVACAIVSLLLISAAASKERGVVIPSSEHAAANHSRPTEGIAVTSSLFEEFPGYSRFSGGAFVGGRLDVNGITRIYKSFPSTSLTTGSLTVEGGVGIKGTINLGEDANIWRDTSVGRNLSVVGLGLFNNTTTSNSPTTGALVVAGGLGVGESLNLGLDAKIGRDTNIARNVTVGGDTSITGRMAINNASLTALTVKGGAGVGGDFTVSGNTGLSGKLSVNGDASLNGKLNVNGEVLATSMTLDVLTINGGSDLAEPYNISRSHSAKPGMIVSIDPARTGELRIADSPYDRTVAGIISGANGINPGLTLKQTGTIASGQHPVALSGRVWVYADADANGAIRAGDLLTTSATPGHAMKVTNHAKSQGAVLGKAMSSLAKGRGLVLALVSLQ